MNNAQKLEFVHHCIESLPLEEDESLLADILWEIYDDVLGEILEELEEDTN